MDWPRRGPGRGSGWNPGDDRTLIAGRDGLVNLWDLPTRRLLRTVSVFPRNHNVRRLVLSPNDQILAMNGILLHPSWYDRLWESYRHWVMGQSWSGPEPTLILVDLATDRPLARYPGRGLSTFSPDGRLFSTYDLHSRSEIHNVPQPARP